MTAGIAGHRFLIVGDDESYRDLIRPILSASGAGEIHEAADFSTAAALLAGPHRPDAMITDMTCSGESCLAFIASQAVQRAEITTVVFTDSDDPDDAVASVRAGAAAFVHKASGPEELVCVFRKIDAGDHYIDHAIAMRMIFANEQAHAEATELSRKELELLRMLGEDKTIAEIADVMDLAYKTVVASCSRLKAKLRITDTEDLLRFARQRRSSDGQRQTSV